jgi:glycosyltransferase involved in cell wall biosynthesis
MAANISIGILAYNEANTIGTSLESLFQQSLFQQGQHQPAPLSQLGQSLQPSSQSGSQSGSQTGSIAQPPVLDRPLTIELIIVPNGCTDHTAAIAQQTLERLAPPIAAKHITWRVCELAEAGKSNAWNTYIHQLASPTAEYFVLMDADIVIQGSETLSRLVAGLDAHPDVSVATDLPKKDVALKPNKTLMEKLSTKISDQDESSTGISGQLYCARAEVLRQIWMPKGLAVEDGFLRAMVVTKGFTEPEIATRIKCIPGTSHLYEAYVTIPSLLRHEKRLLIGTTVNKFVYDYLWDQCRPDRPAGSLIAQNNAENPMWVADLIQQGIKTQGWWLIHESLLLRRFRNLQRYPIGKALLRLPLAILAFGADLWVFVRANQAIHQGKGIGYW